MSHDKKLTSVIVFLWFIAVILIMGVSQNVNFNITDSKPLTSSKHSLDREHVNEASVTVYVIANDSFCGSSSYGECSSNAECIEDGCAGQVCQSKNEGLTISTCEWKECYDNEKYGLSCGCVNGECQWN